MAHLYEQDYKTAWHPSSLWITRDLRRIWHHRLDSPVKRQGFDSQEGVQKTESCDVSEVAVIDTFDLSRTTLHPWPKSELPPTSRSDALSNSRPLCVKTLKSPSGPLARSMERCQLYQSDLTGIAGHRRKLTSPFLRQRCTILCRLEFLSS